MRDIGMYLFQFAGVRRAVDPHCIYDVFIFFTSVKYIKKYKNKVFSKFSPITNELTG